MRTVWPEDRKLYTAESWQAVLDWLASEGIAPKRVVGFAQLAPRRYALVLYRERDGKKYIDHMRWLDVHAHAEYHRQSFASYRFPLASRPLPKWRYDPRPTKAAQFATVRSTRTPMPELVRTGKYLFQLRLDQIETRVGRWTL